MAQCFTCEEPALADKLFCSEFCRYAYFQLHSDNADADNILVRLVNDEKHGLKAKDILRRKIHEEEGR